jgi:hypothetical protein
LRAGIEDFCHLFLNQDTTSPTQPDRGITLMDVLSKVLCKILNERLFKALKLNRTEYQFGGNPDVVAGKSCLPLRPFYMPEEATALKPT